MTERNSSGLDSSTARPAVAPSPAPTWVARCAWCVAALALWISSWSFPAASASTSLDFSCGQALGEAWKRGLAWGTEIAFTYGPLGWCAIGPYDADTFWLRCVAWEFLFKGVWAAALASALTRVGSRVEYAVLALLLVVPVHNPDAQGLLALGASCAWFLARLEREEPRPGTSPSRSSPARHSIALVFLAAACSVIALVKFSWFVLFALATLAIAAAELGHGLRHVVAALAVFIVSLVAAWGFVGGSPLGLLRWIESGWELSQAYGESMSQPPRAGIGETAWVALVATCAALLFWAAARPRSRVRWCSAAFACAASALAHKAGMTRGGGAELTTFAFLSIVPWLFAWRTSGDRRLLTRLAAAARMGSALACVVGFALLGNLVAGDPVRLARRSGDALVDHARTAFELGAFRARREEERERMRAQFALPRTRAAVGTDTLDVFGSEQGLAFLNDLRWTPRPVFQAYAAYTPWLSEQNARFLSGERAPHFVLFRAATIDRRLPGQDDARSLDVLLRDYEPLFPENGHVLLRRRADAPRDPGRRRTELDRVADFGATIDVPRTADGQLYLALELAPGSGTRAFAALVQVEPIWIQVELEGGIVGNFRLLPAVARDGILFEPWLADHEGWLAWCGGQPMPKVRAIRVLPPSPPNAYGSTFRVRAWSLDTPTWNTEPTRRAAFLWPMFDRAPSHIESAVTPRPRRILNRADALVVGAPSRIVFELPRGRTRVSGSFGLLPAARWSLPSGTARFFARVEDDSGTRTVFEGSARVEDLEVAACFKPFDAELIAGSGARFILATRPDPEGSEAASAAFWSGIAFTAPK